MNWKSFPMGAACAERMEVSGLNTVYDMHAVAEPGYQSCIREPGLDYLKSLGYTVVQAI
jgi:hypothetical protein